MMFSDKTYENILSHMLERVGADVDKREGSVIYDALAPCAYELAQTYYNLNQFLDLVFGDTASGEYLDRVVADYGMSRKAATHAVRKVETNGIVNIGTRWGINDTTYKITEMTATNVYSAICEQEGDLGNLYDGALENIDNLAGVTAVLTDVITSGADEETDDNLRSRFYAKVQAPSTSGNADHYKEWALKVQGTGNAKVLPLWDGAGTVKVLVVDSNMEIDERLPNSVAAFIETVRPIGAAVTVQSPDCVPLTISANIWLDGSRNFNDVQASFRITVTEYLNSLVFNTYSVSHAKVGSLLLDTSGVKDYDSLLVNGGMANITIGETQIPTVGMISLTEVD